MVEVESGEWWRGMEALGTWLDSHARRPACGTDFAKPTPCFTRRTPCSATPNCRSRVCAVAVLHGAGEWAYTQTMFLATSSSPVPIMVRQLKKHGQPRLRCDEEWREAHIKLSKEDDQNSTQRKRPHPGQPSGNALSRVSLETPGLRNSRHAIRGLSGTPQKDIEHSWHVVLNSKKHLKLRACAMHLLNVKEDRDDSDPLKCCMVP